MKIATITFHHVYNFGGVLQALALQTFLEKRGHQVQIIDYRPQYLESEYRVWEGNKNRRLSERCSGAKGYPGIR